MFSSNTISTKSQTENEQINVVKTCLDIHGCHLFNRWWHSDFAHQRLIVRTMEKTAFHILIVVLVLLDCAIVIVELLLDFILLKKECKDKENTEHSEHNSSHAKMELATEVLHYASIVLLGIFVLEVLVKIYAYGKNWWNIRDKKMEWLDALIVIVSFILDIYFLKNPDVLGEFSVLFIVLRLWRIVRVINSVAQSVRLEDESIKKNLTEIYTQIIYLMLVVSSKKTVVVTRLRTNFSRDQLEKIIEKFYDIDNSCRSTVERCPKFSSRHDVEDLAQHLQGILEEMRHTSSKVN